MDHYTQQTELWYCPIHSIAPPHGECTKAAVAPEAASVRLGKGTVQRQMSTGASCAFAAQRVAVGHVRPKMPLVPDPLTSVSLAVVRRCEAWRLRHRATRQLGEPALSRRPSAHLRTAPRRPLPCLAALPQGSASRPPLQIVPTLSDKRCGTLQPTADPLLTRANGTPVAPKSPSRETFCNAARERAASGSPLDSNSSVRWLWAIKIPPSDRPSTPAPQRPWSRRHLPLLLLHAAAACQVHRYACQC
jgi:hypothetical protein